MQLANASLPAAWIKAIPFININPNETDKCQQKARMDVIQRRDTTSLRNAPGYPLPVKLLTVGIYSSIYTNISVNNWGVPAALSLQKG